MSNYETIGMEPYIKQGAVYCCPKCKNRMFKAMRDLFSSQRIIPDMFYSIQDNRPALPGETIQCKDCGYIPLRAFSIAENWDPV